MERTAFAQIRDVLTRTLRLVHPVRVRKGGDRPGARPRGVRLPAAVVSCAWLDSHLDRDGLVVVDVRPAEEYARGHLRNAVSMPFEMPSCAWTTTRDDLLMELPDPAELRAALGRAGITRESSVVVVTSVGEPPYPQANATRVAVTLRWAGVEKVAVLDGGHPRWAAEGRRTTSEDPRVTPRAFTGDVDGTAFVGIDHVRESIGSAVLVDARDTAVYTGEVMEPWAQKPGHIPSARSLPAPSIWNEDGTFAGTTELEAMAATAIGPRRGDREVIVYCGVGGYGSAWLFVLTQVLGYRNVTLFDGAAQEWVRHHDLEL